MTKKGSITTKWVVPCNFVTASHSDKPIEVDLSTQLEKILKNEIWKRKLDYGFNATLERIDYSKIVSAGVKILPRFISGIVNKNRIIDFIKQECGEFPSYLNLSEYRKWPYNIGVIIFNIEYSSEITNIPNELDLTEDPIPYIEPDFIESYHEKISVTKELASFFLAGLHLTFPTHSINLKKDHPIHDGVYQVQSADAMYASRISTNQFMHEVMIEFHKIKSNLTPNLNILSSIWHKELWSLKRFLIAVESDIFSVDKILDLLYALEGLFDKNTSKDFIIAMCQISICKTRREALELDGYIRKAYTIRNEIAHGGKSYDPYQKEKVNGKEVLIDTIYWELKLIVVKMIVKAISKLLSSNDSKNLRLNSHDYIEMVFNE